MGYHVTILRTKNGAQKSISQKEVEAVVASMPDLRIESDEHWDFLISLPPHGDEGACLIFSNGEIWAKNPEDETLQIMLNLASKLNARVRGDELETYRTRDETYTHPDDLAIQASERITSKPKHKQWRLRDIPLVIFFIFAIPVVLFWEWLKKRK